MVEMLDRKHGREAITYDHESLEKILEDTYGCIVYQEQVMLASVELAGFSLNDADNLRKAMGKKKPEIWRSSPPSSSTAPRRIGCARDVAQQIWDNIVKFGGYGFNKSHSARLRPDHLPDGVPQGEPPHAFRRQLLVRDGRLGQGEVLPRRVLRRCDIEVAPPSIRSNWEFLPEGEGRIRFGFGDQGHGQEGDRGGRRAPAHCRSTTSPSVSTAS